MMARVYQAGGVWAGVADKVGWVTLNEREKGIDISTGCYVYQLSPAAAHTLAAQLYRFAKRIETHASNK